MRRSRVVRSKRESCMTLLWAGLLVVGVAALAITAMLLVRRRAPEGSYFEDGDRAAGSLRRPGDWVRGAAGVRRLPGVRELRYLAKRLRDGGAGRARAVRDGAALSRGSARPPFRRARLLRAYGDPWGVAEDAGRHPRRPGQPLDPHHVPHDRDGRAAVRVGAGGLREMARRALRPRKCTSGPHSRSRGRDPDPACGSSCS